MSNNFVRKIHCLNFKGFRNRKIEGLNNGLNIFIGDNETGKSSILLAIDLVLGANAARIESIGLDKLLNLDAVHEFLAREDRSFQNLPIMEIDLYLNEQGRSELEGYQNIDDQNDYGIYLRCRPRDELQDQIVELISTENPAFPYEYYMVEIKGFGGETVSVYKKPLSYLMIDNTKISNDRASNSYIKGLFGANTTETERYQLKYGYRQAKDSFSRDKLSSLNNSLDDEIEFLIRNNSKANLETDITISHKGIDIENLGMGRQCFIRTEFALSKKSNIDVILLEEPENHLSHTNMNKLISSIQEASQSQIFIATHSSLVCSRLDLRHAIFFGSQDQPPIKLDKLPTETAEFFMKAPNNAILEFVLSERSLLVEGDAEFMLMEEFHETITGKNLHESKLNVISIGGISFPRYLDIAKILGNKVAVITDNDKDPQSKCIERYSSYSPCNNIQIFFDGDIDRYTFEICIYLDNTSICNELFGAARRSLSVQQYMLNNKADAAFRLISAKSSALKVPEYIRNAIVWLSE